MGIGYTHIIKFYHVGNKLYNWYCIIWYIEGDIRKKENEKKKCNHPNNEKYKMFLYWEIETKKK